jgi:broad specificity phosphatase PhoE
MTLQIQIIRHGRSALPYPSNWITSTEFREWIAVYNRTGIADESTPPAELVATVGEVPVVVCSDYPRSIESAARLVPNRQPRISPVFREVGRPLQANWNVRLPLKVWDRFSVSLWNMNLISSDESIHAARRRAQEATRELVSLAEESSRVLFVGHGMINAMIGGELRRLGWQGPRRVADVFWGITTFRRPTSGG